jgi:hypothetical protein
VNGAATAAYLAAPPRGSRTWQPGSRLSSQQPDAALAEAGSNGRRLSGTKDAELVEGCPPRISGIFRKGGTPRATMQVTAINSPISASQTVADFMAQTSAGMLGATRRTRDESRGNPASKAHAGLVYRSLA